MGEVRVLEVKKDHAAGTAALAPHALKKVVVNLPPEAMDKEFQANEVKVVSGVKILGAHTIIGPHVESVKGSNGSVARIKVKEGMWEERRGHKVDGGERRKENVRSRRAARERGTLKA